MPKKLTNNAKNGVGKMTETFQQKLKRYSKGIQFHNGFEQTSLEWHIARKGVITASGIKRMVTPTLKIANNDKTRSYTCSLISDRVTDFIEENYVSWDMMRGKEDEILARALYSETWDNVEEVGFVTNGDNGVVLGCSPDGLVGDEGMVEIKSRLSQLQVKAVMEDLIEGRVPKDDVMQVQASLLVTGRKWCDYVVYSRGLPMVKVRAYPDEEIHEAMIEAGNKTEAAVVAGVIKYLDFVKDFPLTKYVPFTGETTGFHVGDKNA